MGVIEEGIQRHPGRCRQLRNFGARYTKNYFFSLDINQILVSDHRK